MVRPDLQGAHDPLTFVEPPHPSRGGGPSRAGLIGSETVLGSGLALLKAAFVSPEVRWRQSGCGSLKPFLCWEVFVVREVHDSLGKDTR